MKPLPTQHPNYSYLGQRPQEYSNKNSYELGQFAKGAGINALEDLVTFARNFKMENPAALGQFAKSAGISAPDALREFSKAALIKGPLALGEFDRGIYSCS